MSERAAFVATLQSLVVSAKRLGLADVAKDLDAIQAKVSGKSGGAAPAAAPQPAAADAPEPGAPTSRSERPNWGRGSGSKKHS